MQAHEIPMTKQKDHKIFDHLGFRHAQQVKINLNLTSVGEKMEDLEDGEGSAVNNQAQNMG